MTAASTLYTGPTPEHLVHIPAALTGLRQWVLWRGADRLDTGTGEIAGLNKIPINPWSLHNADTTDPQTWGRFDQCVTALPVALEEWAHADPSAYRGGGLGFVFSETDPYCGIDLDHCIDPVTGDVADWAQHHVDMLDSYTERSPSGTGLHIFVEGRLPPTGRKKGHIEVYDYARFFTMSGLHYAGTPSTIAARQAALDAFHGVVFPPVDTPREHTSTVTICLEDAALLAMARAAKHGVGARFAALWAGDMGGYPSQSEADLALCIRLAFWTQDANQIDRLFRQSSLMREKWHTRRGEQTYGQRTVREALARQTEHYHPRREASQSRNGHTPPAPPAPTQADWEGGLLVNKGGIPQQTINNFALALQHLDPWKREGCWYDVVRERHMVGAAPVLEGDDTAAGIRIEQATAIRVTNLHLVGRALDYVCRQQTRDLLREWVDALPALPVSDHLTTWLRTYANVPDTVSDSYVADVSRIIPVGMIARILRPGCQFRYVPILEGPEDAGKSKLTKALAGQDAYGQSWHVALSAGMEGKEAHMMLDGALIAELEELSSYTKTDENRMKALVTAETDSFIPKFANKRVDHPRRTVFIATVNPEGDGAYLKGQSGNTRYLPITVGTIDIPGFLSTRTQLFAEAKTYFLDHPEDWWTLTCGIDATTEREERRQTSVYESEALRGWLATLSPAECTWQDVAEFYLHSPKDRWNKALQMEISKALRAFKWVPARTGERRYWVRG
jgi:hypothetical protein